MLKLTDLSFAYNKNTTTVEHIDLTINAGEFIALCGRNGSGKTTLSRLIMGMEVPSGGKIELDGTDITGTNVTQRSDIIGYVFQQPDRQMFRNTVREEISFGPEQQGLKQEEIDVLVSGIMKKLNLNDYANAYPLALSRGVKQRIAIASALAMKSRLLILDEPTSGQDADETKELLELLARLHEEGLTIILITHNMDILAAYAQRVVVLSQSKLAFDGTPESFFSNQQQVTELGLSVPTAVRLAQEVLHVPYCKTVEEFVELYKKQMRGECRG